MLTFSPRSVTKELLSGLPERSRGVLTARFGLDKDGVVRTLESIGSDLGITRERVRQIENHGLAAVRESGAYKAHEREIGELEDHVEILGGVISERRLVQEIAKHPQDRNHVIFLLTVGHPFVDAREDDHFVRRWHVDEDLAGRVESALRELHDAVDPDYLIPEEEFMQQFSACLSKAGITKKQSPEVMQRWLEITKRLGRNPLGEWGRASSPYVRVKSMRDLAYLALKRHGSPMHFTEVAAAIQKLFGRKAHPATCHNELIKDPRFVLVGRGLYALLEWGYQPGVVRDVIRGVLAREGRPLSRDELIERVKRERYVKDATILVNLQNGPFRRNDDGLYELV